MICPYHFVGLRLDLKLKLDREFPADSVRLARVETRVSLTLQEERVPEGRASDDPVDPALQFPSLSIMVDHLDYSRTLLKSPFSLWHKSWIDLDLLFRNWLSQEE